MRFILHSSHGGFGPWDWATARERGIGGSETSHIEIARRLARRGHEVISYAPVPLDSVRFRLGFAVDDAGVVWKHHEGADFTLPGTWLVYRAPTVIDRFPEASRVNQRIYLICQDVWYHDLTRENGSKFDAVVALCFEHAKYLYERYGLDNIGISSNGICTDELLRLPNERRHVNRLIWASSPDRGLLTLLRIFRRVRERVPTAELHVFYGFDNIDKAIADWQKAHPTAPGAAHPWARAKAEILREADQPGVVWRGRVGQRELWSEFLRASFWVYPTDFTETSCIASMEAMALGCIPITRPYWPLAENVQHGVLIDGDPVGDALVRARYVKAIVELMGDPVMREQCRADMMPWAQEYFNWEVVVDQVEEWAAEAAQYTDEVMPGIDPLCVTSPVLQEALAT